MQQKLIDYFAAIMPLTAEEAEAILASMSVKTYPKDTVLLREGQVSTECYFVLNGCIRQYCLVNGEEKTNQFFTENEWVISLASFTQQIPATHYWVCQEDTTLVVGNEQRENALYEQSRKFETISRKVIETILGQQQAMAATYLTDTPEQRYLNILELRPDLLQRVPQYQLASYIGVTPESLSRIRKRISRRHIQVLG